MSDAQRWREAMHALGLEWRVGMVCRHGDVCVPCGDDLALIEAVREDVMVDYNGHSEDLAIGLGVADDWDEPDPHHPSNLGHIRDMVREVCTSPDAHSRPNAHGWRVYCSMRKNLGAGDTEAGAWLDALERKAREAKP